jgi:hypothetical protein
MPYTAWPPGSASNCYLLALNRYERLFRLLDSHMLYTGELPTFMVKIITALLPSVQVCDFIVATGRLRYTAEMANVFPPLVVKVIPYHTRSGMDKLRIW